MSLLGSFDIPMERGLLFVGSSLEPPYDLVVNGGALDQVVAATDTDVMVRTRSQSGVVRVRLWRGMSPAEGEVVFDGVLRLATGRVSVYDSDGLFLVTRRFSTPGEHPVAVRVDEPGWAARVDIILERGSESRVLTAVGGRELPAIALTTGERFGRGEELELILSSYDIPFHRLAAAIKLIVLDDGVDNNRVRDVVDWLRLIHPMARESECRPLGDQVTVDIRSFQEGDAGSADRIDEWSLGMAHRLLSALGAW